VKQNRYCIFIRRYDLFSHIVTVSYCTKKGRNFSIAAWSTKFND